MDFGLFNHEDYWQFLTEVSGQPIGPILRFQESKWILDSSTMRIIGNSLQKFRDNLSVPFSGFKNPKCFWTPER